MQRYPLVDVLRGIAALLVLMLHVIDLGEWKTFPTEGLLRGFRAGWVGVDIFFVISGFVISLSAMRAIANAEPNWRRGFVDRRLRRILPLYVLTCLAFIFLVDPSSLLYGWKFAVQHIGSHALFIHNVFPQTSRSINSPSWSIGVEMQFYLLILLSAPWLARAAIWKILLVWVGTAIGWRYASTFVLPPGASDSYLQLIATSQLPATLDAFGLGIVLAKLALSGRLGTGWLRFVLWSVAAAALIYLAWNTYWPHAGYWDVPAMVIGWRTLFAAAAAAVLAALVVCPTDGGWPIRPLRYLGEISYGIYLWHMPVLLTLLAHSPWRGKSLLIATTGATIALASFTWHAMEKQWLTNLSARAKAW